MAFESLSDRFQSIIKKVRGQGKLTEDNMNEMLKEVRVALLEADVNFKVVKEFISNVREQAIGQKVFLQLSPSQMIVKIVHDELEKLLGGGEGELHFEMNKLSVIMMVGLQGTGKTTSAGKLAKLLQSKHAKKPLLVACDVYRPAAIDQLKTVGASIGVEVFSLGDTVSPVEISKLALKYAVENKFDIVILDTAGRLQIDEKLMEELQNIAEVTKPTETLLLVDAMSGQDAVNVAQTFNEKLKISGIIMSKLDGDARGGSALSIKHLTGIPIKFAGMGEKLEDLEVFHPDRMADRILGMGDVMSLVEKASDFIDETSAKKTMARMKEGKFDLNDMAEQMRKMQKFGSLSKIMKFMPNMPSISQDTKDKADVEMKKTITIINSMTAEERRNPSILKNSRKIRIAKGSGTTATDINKVITKFEQMQKLMKGMGNSFKDGKFPKMPM